MNGFQMFTFVMAIFTLFYYFFKETYFSIICFSNGNIDLFRYTKMTANPFLHSIKFI